MKTIKRKKVNPIFDNFQVLSPKQVTFSCYMKMYRKKYNLSQAEMAEICSLYGEPHNIKFDFTEISRYENMKTIPTPHKFEVLMNVMNIDSSML